MAIKITNATVSPQLVYDRFFMENLTMTQRMDGDNSANPYYEVRISYRIYAVDEEGVRHFKPKLNIITIEDYYSVAMTKALQGDTGLAGAMQAIEAALTAIIEDQTDLGSASIV